MKWFKNGGSSLISYRSSCTKLKPAWSNLLTNNFSRFSSRRQSIPKVRTLCSTFGSELSLSKVSLQIFWSLHYSGESGIGGILIGIAGWQLGAPGFSCISIEAIHRRLYSCVFHLTVSSRIGCVGAVAGGNSGSSLGEERKCCSAANSDQMENVACYHRDLGGL